MKSEQGHSEILSPRGIYISLLLVMTVLYRLIASQVDWLGNTSPLMAIAFGGGMLLGIRFCWAPALMLLVSDITLSLMNGWPLGSYMLLTIPFYVVIAIAGASFSRGQKWTSLLFGTLTASLAFYLLANTFAWAITPAYAHNFAGWWQSQTSGLPGFPPSWTFLRNAMLADSIWCLIAAPLFFAKTLVLPRVQLAPPHQVSA